MVDNISEIVTNANEAVDAIKQSETELSQTAAEMEYIEAVVEYETTMDAVTAEGIELMHYNKAIVETAPEAEATEIAVNNDAEELQESANKTKRNLEELKKNMEALQKAVKMISVMIDESNVLSIKASIEAEKEPGKSKIAKAAEVKEKADEASDSSYKIKQILNGILKDAEHTVKSVEKTYDTTFQSLSTINRTVETLVKWMMVRKMH